MLRGRDENNSLLLIICEEATESRTQEIPNDVREVVPKGVVKVI